MLLRPPSHPTKIVSSRSFHFDRFLHQRFCPSPFARLVKRFQGCVVADFHRGSVATCWCSTDQNRALKSTSVLPDCKASANLDRRWRGGRSGRSRSRSCGSRKDNFSGSPLDNPIRNACGQRCPSGAGARKFAYWQDWSLENPRCRRLVRRRGSEYHARRARWPMPGLRDPRRR